MLFSTKLLPLLGSKHFHRVFRLVMTFVVGSGVVVVLVVDVVVVNITVAVEEVVWTGVVVERVVWH